MSAIAQRLNVWLRLGRVSNLPTVWSNCLAGAALAGSDAEPAALGSLMGAMSAFYVGGMFLNDAFDREIDARERPGRPIPSGAVSARSVFGAGFGLLSLGTLACVAVAARHASAVPWQALASSIGLAVCIVSYDAYHKHNPLSPLLMGLCRVMVYVTVAFALAASLRPAVLLGAVALLGHLIGLTYAAKQEQLNRINHLWPLALMALTPIGGLFLSWSDPLLLPWSLLLLAALGEALRFLVVARMRSVPAAIVRLIAAISLVDAVWVAGSGHPSWAVAAVGLWALTRALQRFVPGT